MTLLEVSDLTKRFGGLVANDHITFSLAEGELLSLIGPNGAGKTTLFNCLAGAHAVEEGRILFQGRPIHGLKAHRVAQLGIARTFQVRVASGDLNVLENVMVGSFLRTSSRRAARTRAEGILRELEIAELSRCLVSELPVAAQKRVAMATALATEPKLLLLDEVAAGLNPSEIETIMASIRHIHQALGVTVMLIEHVMELVMRISQRVIVLDYGRKIAEGDPAAIVRNPDVIKAYLGERFVRRSGSVGGREPPAARDSRS
jgi:branched-chain amino acid transport system ATP-binding protein